MLSVHPYPALVLDRWWNLLDANPLLTPLLADCSAELLRPPVNVLRLTLHPDGLAPRILNLAQWRGHLLAQPDRRIGQTRDDRLRRLRAELIGFPGGTEQNHPAPGVALPLRLAHDGRELSMFSIAAHVETATDVTVEELVVETFYPADDTTTEWFRSWVVYGRSRS